jgi:hypothetical protein
MNKIKVKLNAIGCGTVTVGDIELPNVMGVRFDGPAGDVQSVWVQLLCVDGAEVEVAPSGKLTTERTSDLIAQSLESQGIGARGTPTAEARRLVMAAAAQDSPGLRATRKAS